MLHAIRFKYIALSFRRYVMWGAHGRCAARRFAPLMADNVAVIVDYECAWLFISFLRALRCHDRILLAKI